MDVDLNKTVALSLPLGYLIVVWDVLSSKIAEDIKCDPTSDSQINRC